MSPGESSLDSLKLIDVEEIEIDANCSEHEKSDSEQEKDVVSSSKADPETVGNKNDSKLQVGEPVPNEAHDEDFPSKENMNKLTGAKKKPETDKLAVAKVEKSSGPAVKREKSEDKSKTTNSRPSAAFNKTTFASTVKSMSKVLPARAAGSAPRMTRALTAILPANKPVMTRRTTAGLLITSQRLQSTPLKLIHKKPETPRYSRLDVNLHQLMLFYCYFNCISDRSPKQQRISLVARQSQFAQTNRGGPGGRGQSSRGKLASSSALHTETPSSILPQGSTTSLNSG